MVKVASVASSVPVVQHRPAGGHVHAHNLQRVGIALDPRGELAGHVHLKPLHASRLGVLEAEAGHVDLRADAQHVARRRAAGKRQHRATQSRARRGQRRPTAQSRAA